MGTRYYKLFDLLNRRGMKKSDLRQILSPKTVAKLSKGEWITGEVIEKICLFLDCQPGDMMEIVTDIDTAEINTDEILEIYKVNYIADTLNDVSATDTLVRYRDQTILSNTDNPFAEL